MTTLQIDAEWNGPYGWPEINLDLPSLPDTTGVYLSTVDFDGGYMIYSAGFTEQPLRERLRRHKYNYMFGNYSVLDIDAMRLGIRKVIWVGFGERVKRPPDREREYLLQKTEIDAAALKQLSGFRIFVANIGTERRLMARLESAIMDILYKQPPPFSVITDRGMSLSRRWESEPPITVTSKSTVTLHGLPPQFDI